MDETKLTQSHEGKPTFLSLSLPEYLRLVALSLLFVVVYFGVLKWGSYFFKNTPLWVIAMAINMAIALIIACHPALATKDLFAYSKITRFYFVPALVIIMGSILMALLSGLMVKFESSVLSFSTPQLFYLCSITLIPIVEEVVFRGGLTRILAKKSPRFWASFFSALTFSLLHSLPVHSEVKLDFDIIGLPIGPLLLGFGCEFLTQKSRTLLPAIFFHMACNATVVVFYAIDKRWFDFLSWLY